ncbi:MAG: hypothetical protein HKO64_10455 [Xanthomonadales bacterium]|nr:hypothetical protein [Gammaproteobacteria bacterium]NNE04142.1 hypothetical protein [Xanthomonadales bacterium]NNL96029.1 hypothetical protein [Xanthomonadales bacterium]
MKLKALLIFSLGMFAASAAYAGHNSHTPGYRSGDSWAHEYAQTALRQVRQNYNRGCGYHGQRWTDSYQAHYRWALRVDWRTSQAEIEKRESDLRRCRSGTGHYSDRHHDDRNRSRGHRGHGRSQPLARFSSDELARWYAETALAQVGQSNRYGCRLSSSSGRWSRSWRSHYRWALGQSRRQLMSEIRRRERIIEDCSSYAYRGY